MRIPHLTPWFTARTAANLRAGRSRWALLISGSQVRVLLHPPIKSIRLRGPGTAAAQITTRPASRLIDKVQHYISVLATDAVITGAQAQEPRCQAASVNRSEVLFLLPAAAELGPNEIMFPQPTPYADISVGTQTKISEFRSEAASGLDTGWTLI